MRGHLGLSLLAALAAATLLALSGAPALANHVQCGDVITQDTTLDSDLIDCPGDGIVIGADGITLDLGGHLVDGIKTSFSAGIRNIRSDDITVRNGRVSQFRDGVTLEYASSDNVVQGLTVTDAIAGIYVNAAGSVVENNRISVAGQGIDIYGAHSMVRRNTLDRNGTGIRTHEPAEITNNIIVNNGGSGVLMVETGDSLVSRNLVLNNGTQQSFPHGAGITMFDLNQSVVERNVVARNVLGMKLAEYSQGNLVRKNEISSNAVDGILLMGGFDNVLDHNSTIGNGDDGIDFDPEDGGPVELRRNRVGHNGDLGIEAEGDVIDGGGNRALSNGNPLQCLIVVCK